MELAELLFPDIKENIDDLEKRYPERKLAKGAKVVRLGPSPTGFIHLGNLYVAFLNRILANRSKGVFFLRIEDTDNTRKVEGAVEMIIDKLKYFDITFDEGSIYGGEYSPYVQSERKDIYQTVAKELVKIGKAYPSFLTEEELSVIRKNQEASKEQTGIYGKYATERELSLDTVKDNIASGKKWVLRLRSSGDTEKLVDFNDGIRGKIRVHENDQDIVLLKVDGIPTYHFAHIVDDHLMRTTHVLRGEEWLSSLPCHLELFKILGWTPPTYCHTPHLMKLDNGNKRKLSKRKDPELSLEYYASEGYFPEAVKEYLMTLYQSDYEEWREKNPKSPMEDFDFSLDKMGFAGALFDMDKLENISKDVLLGLSAEEIFEFFKEWVKEFRKEDLHLIESHKEEIKKLFDIGRDDEKPRKDLVKCSQIFDHISYYFDSHFKLEGELPKEVERAEAKEILKVYLETLDLSDDKDGWFEKIKRIANERGYALKPKDYKKNPKDYKGSISHISQVIRLALTGRENSPDLYSIQKIMGYERVKKRLSEFS